MFILRPSRRLISCLYLCAALGLLAAPPGALGKPGGSSLTLRVPAPKKGNVSVVLFSIQAGPSGKRAKRHKVRLRVGGFRAAAFGAYGRPAAGAAKKRKPKDPLVGPKQPGIVAVGTGIPDPAKPGLTDGVFVVINRGGTPAPKDLGLGATFDGINGRFVIKGSFPNILDGPAKKPGSLGKFTVFCGKRKKFAVAQKIFFGDFPPLPKVGSLPNFVIDQSLGNLCGQISHEGIDELVGNLVINPPAPIPAPTPTPPPGKTCNFTGSVFAPDPTDAALTGSCNFPLIGFSLTPPSGKMVTAAAAPTCGGGTCGSSAMCTSSGTMGGCSGLNQPAGVVIGLRFQFGPPPLPGDSINLGVVPTDGSPPLVLPVILH